MDHHPRLRTRMRIVVLPWLPIDPSADENGEEGRYSPILLFLYRLLIDIGPDVQRTRPYQLPIPQMLASAH